MTIAMDAAQPGQPGAARVWTIDAVRALAAMIDIETAGAVLGIGRSKSYEMAKNGEFPVRIVRIGRRYLVPTSAILALLGIDDGSATGAGGPDATRARSEKILHSRR
jgi:excisionase family DNA binding protein